MGQGHDDTGATIERELALALGSIDPQAVARHPLVSALAIDAGVSERLVSTYYDTADRALFAQGIVLRVREKQGRFVQTVKAGGPKGAGVAARDEWESALDGPQPLWPVSLPGPAGTSIVETAARSGIATQFVTDFTRTRRRLATPGGDVVELAVDIGEIRAGTRTAQIREVELELESGSATGLFDLALKLLEDLPLGLQTISKGERGYLLASGESPQPVIADRTALDPAMSIADAFDVIVPAAAGHAVNNTPAIVEGDDPVEGVHQMRVGLRRLRAALAIFKPHLAQDAHTHMRRTLAPLVEALGPARDLDVFLTETMPPALDTFQGHAAVRALNERAVALRDQERTALHVLLTGPEYTRNWLTVGHWLAARPVQSRDDVAKLARKVLKRRAKAVRRAGEAIDGRSDAALHELRIQIKKLRYAAEFFASLYDEDRVKPMLKALRKAQNALGHLNDVAACEAVLARIEADTPRGAAHDVIRGAGMVSGWLRARHGALRAKAEKAYGAYAKLKPFWR